MGGGADDGLGERTLILTDGATIPYRPMQPGDVAALQAFHRTLSPQSVYHRYFGIVPELSVEWARHFTAVDGYRRYALVALDPDCPRAIVGVASFDREGDTHRAECAVAVADRWQRRGVGLGLIQQLLYTATRRGIDTVCGYVLPDNRAILGLLGKVGYPRRTGYEGGRVWVEIDLTNVIPDACVPS